MHIHAINLQKRHIPSIYFVKKKRLPNRIQLRFALHETHTFYPTVEMQGCRKKISSRDGTFRVANDTSHAASQNARHVTRQPFVRENPLTGDKKN